MAVTEPENLANVGWNGDTVETEVTNDPRNAGFPARKADGGLVFIVKQYYVGRTKVMEDKDGNKFVDFSTDGTLREFDAEADTDANVTDTADSASDEALLDSEAKKSFQAAGDLPPTNLDAAKDAAEVWADGGAASEEAVVEEQIRESDQQDPS